MSETAPRVIQVIESYVRRGTGDNADDPVRFVVQYHTPNGKLLWESEPRRTAPPKTPRAPAPGERSSYAKFSDADADELRAIASPEWQRHYARPPFPGAGEPSVRRKLLDGGFSDAVRALDAIARIVWLDAAHVMLRDDMGAELRRLEQDLGRVEADNRRLRACCRSYEVQLQEYEHNMPADPDWRSSI